MGKYIINIRETTDRIICVGVKDGETYASGVSVSCLMPYTEPDLEQVRKEAYEQGYDDAAEEKYTDGLADAWEAVKKLAQMDTDTSESITGYFGLHNIMHNLTASEVIEEIRAYEQAQKEKEEQIQVGDEVITASGKAVVTGVGPVHFEYDYADGSHGYDEVKNVKKTGRNFPEIAEVLRKMRESE